MIKYKVDILEELKKCGYSSYRIRKDKLLSQQTLQHIRDGKSNLSLATLNDLCVMLRCQPSDILEVTITDEEKIRFF